MISQRPSRVIDWRILCVVALLAHAGVAPVVAEEGSIQEAEELNQQVFQLYGQGRYREAIPLAARAVAITEQALGPTHPSTAQSLNNLAALYKATGAYSKAEPLLQRALAINEQSLGPTHPSTAAALNNLAMLYKTTGAYDKAEPLLQRALAIKEHSLGPTHPATATSLNNLAGLYRVTGAYSKAEPLYQRALAIREQGLGPEHPDTAASLNNLAMFYFTTGAYDQAEPLYQRALAITEQALGPTHPTTATSLNNLAMVYEITGAYEKAQPLYQRALAIREQALGPTHPDTAASLNNLAGLYNGTGAYSKAEPLYQQALAIREQALGPTHPTTAAALNNLAVFYFNRGTYPKAESLLQRALAIHEQVLGPTHPDTASSLNNLAALYDTTGAYDQAEPLYHRALAIHEQTLGPTHPTTAILLDNLALLHWASGNPATALPLYERTQVIHEKHTEEFLLSGSEARKQAYMQQLNGITSVKVSLSVREPCQQAVALGLTSVLHAKGRVLDAMSDSVARLRQRLKPEDRRLFEQFTELVRQQSTLSYQGPGALPPDVYRALLRELAAKQEQLETELASRSTEFRHQIEPITLTAIQAALPAEAVLLEWFRYEPFDPKAKNEKTKWENPRYVAYVLKRAGAPVAVDLGEAESIELLVQDFRKALSDPQHTYVKEVAQELSAKLIKPLQSYLGTTERLLISPDGALNLVPFGALLDNTGEYLATKREITYLTSGRDLLRFGSATIANSEAVVVANPDFGLSVPIMAENASSIRPNRSADLDRGGLVFKPLLGTAAEAKALTPLLKVKDENLLTQAKATEARLKQLHGPRLLHIATHGFFLSDKEMAAAMLKPIGFSQDPRPLPLGENPLLRSGLALAGANARRSGKK